MDVAPNEPFLKDYICPNCHVAILEDHPEEKFALQNYIKCKVCGFSKKIDKKKSKVDRIIFSK